MKKFYLTFSIALLLLICAIQIQAQTTQTQLNQVELMKQWIGSWKTEGTPIFSEIKSFGNDGLEGFQKTIVNDTIRSEHKFIYGYDKKSDKYVSAGISKNNSGILLMVFWFTSKNTCEKVPFEYISNPEQATSKAIYEFKSPDSMIATFIEKDKPTRTYTVIRVIQ
jgi:hypothetical protein